MSTELIINTASRRGAENSAQIIELCRDNGIKVTRTHRLKNPKRLHTLLEKIVARKPSLVIVASGDGTISDVVDVLAGTKIELGFIPVGTTNNFARSLSIPLDITQSVKAIANRKARPVDLGVVNGDYYANVAGIGISADVAGTIPDSLKKRYGRMAYAIHGLKLLWKHTPFRATISDAKSALSLNVETHQIIIANGRYHAGSEIAGDAGLKSRELVVFKLGGPSRLSFIWHMIDFYVGTRRSVAHSSYVIAKDITIKTNIPVAIELDGEVKESTPAHIQIKPAALLVRH